MKVPMAVMVTLLGIVMAVVGDFFGIEIKAGLTSLYQWIPFVIFTVSLFAICLIMPKSKRQYTIPVVSLLFCTFTTGICFETGTDFLKITAVALSVIFGVLLFTTGVKIGTLNPGETTK